MDPTASRALTLVLILGASQVLAAAPAPRSLPGSLTALLAAAEERNGDLRAARAAAEEARAAAAAAGALPDPRLSLGWFAREVETRVGPQQWKAGLSQTLPGRGKLSTNAAIARLNARALASMAEEVRLRVLSDVTRAWAEYGYLSRATTVTEDNLRLLEELEAVALASYRSGRASHGDVVRAQIETERLRDRLAALVDHRGALSAAVTAAAGIPTGEPIPFPDEIPTPAPLADQAALEMLLVERNPSLAAARVEAEAARAGLRLAHRARRPDVTLGLETIGTGEATMAGVADSGKDPLVASVSFNLPLRSAPYADRIRAARERVTGREARVAQLGETLVARLRAARFRVDDARRRRLLYRDSLVPMARQALEVLRTGFAAGRGDFLDLVDAERSLLEFRLAVERALADEEVGRADLEALVGRLPEVAP